MKISETICNRYTVWLYWDQLNLQFVALKIMKSVSTTKAAAVEIELIEHTCRCDPDGSHKCKIIKLLDSFNLIGIYGTHVCMVFEVLDKDLFKYKIESGNKGLPLAIVKRIVKEVLEALEYLHTTCEIIHTDIKPDNICLVDDVPGEVLAVTIADLGSACWVDRHFSAIIQSSAYRCPEVLARADYGPNVDSWSMACVTFELATGVFLFPFHAEESRMEDRLHMKRILKLLSGIPKIGLVTEKYGWDEENALQFTELPMLAIDPSKHSSAKDALKHQWLKF